MSVDTKPEVFIIESLDIEDEEKQRLEGQIISSILALSGKECKYYYIRTRRELEEMLVRFTDSNYRYLHLSCHGGADKQTIHTTFEAIPLDEFGPMVKPHLRNRRLFLSACSMANGHVAKAIMPGSGCYSILGPIDDIKFKTAAILWASLYHVMFDADTALMKHPVLTVKAQEVADMFRVKMNYIRASSTEKKGYSIATLTPSKKQVVKTAAKRKARR